jgi:hypothetical protein
MIDVILLLYKRTLVLAFCLQGDLGQVWRRKKQMYYSCTNFVFISSDQVERV